MENNHHDDELQPAGDDTLLARWLAGNLTPEDLESLRNLEGYPDYVEMLHALEGMDVPEFSPTLAWQKLQPALEAEKAKKATETIENQSVEIKTEKPLPAVEPPTPVQPPVVAPVVPEPVEKVANSQPVVPSSQQQAVVRSIGWQRWAAVAAVVLLGVAGIWWFAGRDNFSFTDTDYLTKAGEKKEVKLPDGSVVMLNAASKLGFSANDWSEKRTVALEGEAYFRAKKGRTFTVRTEQGLVEVVGTVFNVYARGEELEVKCTEGRVQVINPDQTERVLLKKGEQVSVLRGRMQERRGLAFYPNWFKGESTFRSAPLERVFGEMERQFGVTVLADSLGERTFSGKFVHKDLNKAVKMVCDPMKLQCEVRGDTVWVE